MVLKVCISYSVFLFRLSITLYLKSKKIGTGGLGWVRQLVDWVGLGRDLKNFRGLGWVASASWWAGLGWVRK